jgi:hypothetical protein
VPCCPAESCLARRPDVLGPSTSWPRSRLQSSSRPTVLALSDDSADALRGVGFGRIADSHSRRRQRVVDPSVDAVRVDPRPQPVALARRRHIRPSWSAAHLPGHLVSAEGHQRKRPRQRIFMGLRNGWVHSFGSPPPRTQRAPATPLHQGRRPSFAPIPPLASLLLAPTGNLPASDCAAVAFRARIANRRAACSRPSALASCPACLISQGRITRERY